MLNVTVSDPVTDLIHFQVCLQQKFLRMVKAQIIQIYNKAAAAFLCKPCTEILFVQRNVVCHHLQAQFRVGVVVLQESNRFLDAVGTGASRLPGAGILYPAQKSPQPERKLCRCVKAMQLCGKIFFSGQISQKFCPYSPSFSASRASKAPVTTLGSGCTAA